MPAATFRMAIAFCQWCNSGLETVLFDDRCSTGIFAPDRGLGKASVFSLESNLSGTFIFNPAIFSLLV
jgi:hypothetical protein